MHCYDTIYILFKDKIALDVEEGIGDKAVGYAVTNAERTQIIDLDTLAKFTGRLDLPHSSGASLLASVLNGSEDECTFALPVPEVLDDAVVPVVVAAPVE